MFLSFIVPNVSYFEFQLIGALLIWR